jgi:hypothetical protein
MKTRTLKSILVSFSLLLMMIGDSSAAVEARKIDEISNFNWEDLMARLDFYAIELQTVPDSSGHLIIYNGRRSLRGEVQGWMDCVKNYLVESRGVDSNRILIVNSGYREKMTVEMWLVPRGETMPQATPTVKPGDVKFRKGRLKKKDWGSLCNI